MFTGIEDLKIEWRGREHLWESEAQQKTFEAVGKLNRLRNFSFIYDTKTNNFVVEHFIKALSEKSLEKLILHTSTKLDTEKLAEICNCPGKNYLKELVISPAPGSNVDFSQLIQLCHPKLKHLQHLDIVCDNPFNMQHDLQSLPKLTYLKLRLTEKDWLMETLNKVLFLLNINFNF